MLLVLPSKFRFPTSEKATPQSLNKAVARKTKLIPTYLRAEMGAGGRKKHRHRRKLAQELGLIFPESNPRGRNVGGRLESACAGIYTDALAPSAII